MPSDLKMLGLFPYFGPSSIGGIQESSRIAWAGLTEGISRQGGPAYLLSYERGIDASLTFRGADTVVTRSKWRAGAIALAKNWSPDVIVVWHIHFLKLLPFCRAPHARVALFLHGVEAWPQQSWLTRVLLRKVNLFLSNSDFTRRSFLDSNPWYANKPHQTIHLGIGAAVDGEVPAPGPCPVALMLGRLLRCEDYKGHREMIDAWPTVLARLPDAELWIAGDGDLREDLKQYAVKRGLGNKVRFLGRVSEEEKHRLLSECRCLALPSRGEGFGLVYLEAMRLGKPCLVSVADAGQQVINPPEAGLAVDPKDTSALAGAVCQLLTPGPEWQMWSLKARARYEGNFTARHFQDRLWAAISPLLRGEVTTNGL